MSNHSRGLGPDSPKDLEDPAFLKFLEGKSPGGPIEPEWQDFDATANPRTEAEQAEQYRLAQARRLIRLYQEWKAGQN